MTLEEFELFNDIDKEVAIWKDGIFLVNYDEGDHMYDVYELFKFYVAFSYNLNQKHKGSITSSTFPDSLPYLIKLNELN